MGLRGVLQKAVTTTLVAVTEVRPKINVTSDTREQDAKSLKDTLQQTIMLHVDIQTHTKQFKMH